MSGGPVFLDFFAGFGGSSSGLVEAGYELATAYNHWDKAIAVHSANHRNADHVQGDLSGYDMRRLPRKATILWASPECTWHSPAGGRKRVRVNDAALFGESELPADAGVRSRATMFDPIRAAEARNFDAVMIENVPEVAAWPLFDSWLKMWEALGYSWQIVNVSAAHVYGPGNAPAGQWRDRIYIVFARKGITIPPIEPRPLAWCGQCEAVVESRQWWKKTYAPGAPRVGKYGRQYAYVCPSLSHARHIVEPYVLPAAAVIDWSDTGERIGDRKRALAAATMRRIEVGLRMFARPAVVAHSGQTWDAANPAHPRHLDSAAYYRAWDAAAEPLMARQAGGSGDAIAVPPYVVPAGGSWNDVAASIFEPMRTRLTRASDGLVFPPYLIDKYDYAGGDERRLRNVDTPVGTVTASPHAMLAIPPFLTEFYGTGSATPIDAPVGTVTAGAGHHALTIPPGAFLSRQYGTGGAEGRHLNTSIWEPTHPMTATGGNHALVIPDRNRHKDLYEGALPFDLDDVRFRMLTPVEHLRAQRFWEGYDTSAANKSETTKGAGNAVAVNVAHWIGAEVLEAVA